MSDLAPYTGAVVSRESRRAGREISRGRMGAQVRMAAADDGTDLALAKIENQTMATGSAMQSVTRVAMAQRQLEQMAPEAAGRLAFLADDHMFGCADILGDLRREMRRGR